MFMYMQYMVYEQDNLYKTVMSFCFWNIDSKEKLSVCFIKLEHIV